MEVRAFVLSLVYQRVKSILQDNRPIAKCSYTVTALALENNRTSTASSTCDTTISPFPYHDWHFSPSPPSSFSSGVFFWGLCSIVRASSDRLVRDPPSRTCTSGRKQVLHPDHTLGTPQSLAQAPSDFSRALSSRSGTQSGLCFWEAWSAKQIGDDQLDARVDFGVISEIVFNVGELSRKKKA
eukprot:CAMPEP_0114526460 /NCGR_PEP_ID=MMETSP0109-20121206/23030_1 /TAXON_ID=29199 /ORGANISM="Chlorarachnion reptans, Strain CCCM449" /LENGTH=182 /DNA_ID=CAMNT_0001708231 /DNA_START=685 /DNA_END=1232 /DNA_ORIENTATION=+